MDRQGNREIEDNTRIKHCALVQDYYTGQNHTAPVTYSMGSVESTTAIMHDVLYERRIHI